MGVLIEIAIMLFVIFCPGVNKYIFQSTPIWGL